ncbi:MAG: hypothetical protein AAFU85_14305 [Planctomycetota bacterium]
MDTVWRELINSRVATRQEKEGKSKKVRYFSPHNARLTERTPGIQRLELSQRKNATANARRSRFVVRMPAES